MPKCRVCGFAQNYLINLALRSGQSVPAVRQQWRHLSTAALERHQRHCLGLIQGATDERMQYLSAGRPANDR